MTPGSTDDSSDETDDANELDPIELPPEGQDKPIDPDTIIFEPPDRLLFPLVGLVKPIRDED